MDYRILGPLEVSDGDRPLALGAGKQRALLAILLLHANEVVSCDRLIDDLWGAHPPGTAAKALQVHVSHLRKGLAGDRPGRRSPLVTRAPGYVLAVGDDELDAARFERLVREGAAEFAVGNPGRAAQTYREALALWRGPPLSDVTYESFAAAEVTRLLELRSAAVEGRIEADLARGRHREVVAELESMVQAKPVRERLRGHLMLSLYRSGRQAEALEVYRAARATLVGELGIEPGAQLRDLHQAILRQDPGLDVAIAAEAEGPRSPFVGRETELGELVAGLDDAFAGRGRLVLLVGDPGAGKSRLADELSATARARGARVLVGRCWEAGGAPPYWPWVQSLRAYVRDTDTATVRAQLGSGAADVTQILPELRDHLPVRARPLDSAAARFRLFDATAEFLRNAAEQRPIVLVLDDLHAADPASLLLLQYLARELRAARLLVLAACRDVDPIPGPGLTALLADVAREPVTRRVDVGGLSEADVARYVELTAPALTSAELAAALHQETGGNALFVGELVRLIAVEGVGSDPTAGIRLTIPQSVRDVIARRLAHLSAECNRVLVLASVLGREFAVDGLLRLAGVSDDELLTALDEALTARVLTDVPGAAGQLRFAHVLIRDTLYENLSTARRTQLHRAALEALEALYADHPEPHVTELAHHSLLGGRAVAGKAIDYAIRAARHAAAQLSYEQAARHYANALELGETTGRADAHATGELLLALGDVLSRSGSEAEAKEVFRRAAALAEAGNRPEQLARAALGYGGRFVWGRAASDPDLVPLLERALAALGGEDGRESVRLLARLAAALRDEPSRERRVGLAREAVAMARRLGDPLALAYALDGYASAVGGPGDVAGRIAVADELIDLGRRTGDKEREYVAHDYRLNALWTLADRRGLDAEIDALGRLAGELRQPAQRWHACAAQTMLALMEGRFTRAEALIAQARDLGGRAQGWNAEVSQRLALFVLRREQGRLGELAGTMARSVREYPALPRFRAALAHLHAALGRDQEARAALGGLLAPERAREHVDEEWLFGMCLLPDACVAVDDSDLAAALYDLLMPYARLYAQAPTEASFGCVARGLGLLAASLGRLEEAEEHFDAALATERAMGARPWLAHAQQDFADLLLRRGRAGDAERGQALAREASATYAELGMTAWAERAAVLCAGGSSPLGNLRMPGRG